jgi:biotin carboxyl carrier protein
MKKFKFKIDGSEYEVSINEIEHNIAEIEVNGTPFTVEIEKQEKASSMSTMSRKPAGKVAAIKTPARSVVANAIKAPLPGSIMKVLVSNGQQVKRGDVLLTMESMKMENNILAEHDGIIRHIHVQPGQSVMQDDILIDFEGTDTEIPVAQPTKTTNATEAPKPSAAGRRHPVFPGDRRHARQLRLQQLRHGHHATGANLAAQRHRQAGVGQDL